MDQLISESAGAPARTASANAATLEYLEISDKSFGECRQRLITYLVKLSHAMDANLPDLSQALLSRFCDALVDYLSAGHFRVFQRVVPRPDQYAAIESTTRVAMAFNDRFGEVGQVQIPELKLRLETLALVLGTRFELEDEILDADRLQFLH